MTDYFNELLGMVIPVWVYIALPLLLIIIVLIIVWFVQTRIFKARLRRIVDTQDTHLTEEAIKDFEQHYPAEKLVRYSKRMERYSRQMGPQVVRETGLADKWIQKLTGSAIPGTKDLRRVLLYCPSSSIFKAFLATGRHPRLQQFFLEWTQKEGEEKVIRLLAENCRGEDFDPALGKSFLENQSSLLRELTSEPEWFARYFAYRILLIDKETLTEKSLEDGLMDPHPLIRKIITENISFKQEETSQEGNDQGETGGEKPEQNKTWTVLWDKLIHDPVYEVREAARKRIGKEFASLYIPKEAALKDIEKARVLELLDQECQEDRIYAMDILENPDKELRYPAAAFLEKCGVLNSLLEKNTFDDPDAIERSSSLLQKALEVNVSGFLNEYPSGDGAPLMAAAKLLTGSGGTVENICQLEKKVFAFFSDKKPNPTITDIYTMTLDAVVKNGNVKALELFAEEVSRREKDEVFLKLLLPKIPNRAEALFSPILFRFLENTAFPAREELVQVLGTFSPEIVLPETFRILNGSRADYPHEVRISALKILGHLKLPYSLQRILESLPTLKTEETEEFGKIIGSFPKDMFEERVGILLASPDARIRASLITVLPVTKNEGFMKEIRASLKDVDPDVRVAAIKALLGFGEIKLLNQETSMLRDPIERVRLATVEVIARHGNTAALDILKNITTDENETDTVKIGVITGLGQASSPEGIPILVSVLDSGNEFSGYAEKALSNRTSKRDITQLIEIFKDAEPPLREKLIPVFKGQGKEAEPWILEILKDEVASLKPYLVQILEETGFVDKTKKRLSNRKVEVRREAAQFLSLLDTLPAFRGLVLAAKDPDQEVRVCVVKALEKLKSSQSQEMLEKLKEDPDNRIRKYTYWALERLDSLSSE